MFLVPGVVALLVTGAVMTGFLGDRLAEVHRSSYVASQYYSLGLLLLCASIPWFLYRLVLIGGEARGHLMSQHGQLVAAADYLVPKAAFLLFLGACAVLDWTTCVMIFTASAVLTMSLFWCIGVFTRRGALLVRELVPGVHLVAIIAGLYVTGTLLFEIHHSLAPSVARVVDSIVGMLLVSSLVSWFRQDNERPTELELHEREDADDVDLD